MKVTWDDDDDDDVDDGDSCDHMTMKHATSNSENDKTTNNTSTTTTPTTTTNTTTTFPQLASCVYLSYMRFAVSLHCPWFPWQSPGTLEGSAPEKNPVQKGEISVC